ncbi:MAG: tetratricopeptide repeat protein, partial [Rhodobacteraceae bacterium]|nr:tetratricopeptide repeat protein [Paracoccaceae bacterium]
MTPTKPPIGQLEDPSVAGLIAQAISAHKNGDLDTAEGLYRQVLGRVPDHAQALYLTGSLECQRGRF